MKSNVRKAVLIGIGVLSAAALTGCGSKTDAKIAEIQGNGMIRVAVPEKESIFFYIDPETEQYAGANTEVTETIASALNVGIQYIPADSDSFENLVTSGSADIAIGTINREDVDTSRFASTVSYGNDFLYVVTNRGFYPGDDSVFEGQSVGVAPDVSASARSDISSGDKVAVYEYDDLSNVAEDLESGEIKGFFCYNLDASEILQLGDFQIQNAPGIEKEEYVIITSAENQKLVSGMNVLIQQYLTAPKAAPEESEGEAEGEEAEE